MVNLPVDPLGFPARLGGLRRRAALGGGSAGIAGDRVGRDFPPRAL